MQFIPLLESRGWEVEVSALFSDGYLEAKYQNRPVYLNALLGYIRRFVTLFRIKSFDVVWLEKEIFPWLPLPVEQILSAFGLRYVVDFDDAVFHNYDLHPMTAVRHLLGSKIDRIMRSAQAVVVGSPYLHQRALKAGAKMIHDIPTVIQTSTYQKSKALVEKPANRRVRVGWIGSPATIRFVDPIFEALVRVRNDVDFEFVLIGAKKSETFKNFAVTELPWTENSEVELISSLDIGIMPLSDTPWERGKCGYKIVQYMGAGLPVVASNVGANSSIIQDDITGFLVESIEDWHLRLTQLIRDPQLRASMGVAGLQRATAHYSVDSQIEKLRFILGNKDPIP